MRERVASPLASFSFCFFTAATNREYPATIATTVIAMAEKLEERQDE